MDTPICVVSFSVREVRRTVPTGRWLLRLVGYVLLDVWPWWWDGRSLGHLCRFRLVSTMDGGVFGRKGLWIYGSDGAKTRDRGRRTKRNEAECASSHRRSLSKGESNIRHSPLQRTVGERKPIASQNPDRKDPIGQRANISSRRRVDQTKRPSCRSRPNSAKNK